MKTWAQLFFMYMRFGLVAAIVSIPFSIAIVVYHAPEKPLTYVAIGLGVIAGFIEERLYTGKWT